MKLELAVRSVWRLVETAALLLSLLHWGLHKASQAPRCVGEYWGTSLFQIFQSRRRAEVALVKCSSESPLSSWPPPDLQDGDQHTAAKILLSSEPPSTMKSNRTIKTLNGSNLHIRNYELLNILGTQRIVWLLVVLTPTGSSCSFHTVRPKKENSGEMCTEDSWRGTRHTFVSVLFVFFVFVFFLLSLNRVKV